MTLSTSSFKSLPEQSPTWHTLSISEVLRAQNVTAIAGLSPSEAKVRLAAYGSNTFATEQKESGWHAFLRQYQDPMQIVLLVAGIASAII